MGQPYGVQFQNTIRMIAPNQMMLTYGDSGQTYLYVRIR